MSAWPQCTMLYDGTFAGFLTCVGESFRVKQYPFYFLPPGAEQVSLYPIRAVPSDPALAREVYRALDTQVSAAFRQLVTYSFLTCLPQKERHIFDVVYLGFSRALPRDRPDERLLILERATRRLTQEAKQYQDGLRFHRRGEVLVGQIAPQNRLLPLLRPHFCRALAGEAFLIHDTTHREGLFYADHRWKLRPVDGLEPFQPLWQRFTASNPA